MMSADLRGQGLGGGQQAPNYTCGIFQKLGGTVPGYTGEGYYDRFGNAYTDDDMYEMAANVTDECTAGVFKLSFSGDYTTAERDQVCTALTYLSGQVNNFSDLGIVPLKIEFNAGLGTAGAAASAFMEAGCGLMKNYALVNIRTNSNALPVAYYAGLIQINADLNWYTGIAMPTDLNDWNTNANFVGKVDLYTAVLHEGMHILGVASTFGGSIQGGSIVERYTDWDRFLYKKVTNSYIKLIQPASDPQCCSKQQKNPNAPIEFPGTCTTDIMFRDGSTDYAEVSYQGLSPAPGNIGDLNNRLSHLDIECGPNDASTQYVMHRSLNPSPEQYSFPRRVITQAEKDILCKIGYKVVPVCYSCSIVIANDDHYMMFLNSAPSTNPLRIRTGILGNPPDGILALNLAFLSSNDVAELFINGTSFELCGADNQITVTPVYGLPPFQNNIVRVDVTGTVPGTWKFCYRMRGCSNSGCDVATVYITVLENPVPTLCNTHDCNLVCFGDFEAFATGDSKYYPSLALPEFYFTSLSTVPKNTPDVTDEKDATPPNKLVRWVTSTNHLLDQESLRIPLSQPISAGCTITVKYKAAVAKSNYAVAESRRIEIYGLTAPPCTAIADPPSWGAVGSSYAFCTGVDAFRMGQNNNVFFDPDVKFNSTSPVENLNLEAYEFTYTHPTGAAPITDLLIWGTFTHTGAVPPHTGLNYFMDDLIVTNTCNSQITIKPTILQECLSGQAVIRYEVCLQGSGTSPVQIDLQAQIPFGLTAVPGGGFDIHGIASFQLTPGVNCNGGTNSTVVTLTMDVSPNFDPSKAPIAVPVPLDFMGSGLCVNPSNGGGDVTLMLQTCTTDPISCACPPGSVVLSTIGNNPFSSTMLTSSLDNKCVIVNGRLEINTDQSIKNSTLIMNRGAELIVSEGARLMLENNTIEGCTQMWKGITVLNASSIDAQNNRIRDAQYAIQLRPGYQQSIVDNNELDRDFVGIYIPPPPNGSVQANQLDPLHSNKFRCNTALKPAYALPEAQTPTPGQYAYSGILMHNRNGLFVGSTNLFEGLRNGVVARNSNFTVARTTFNNIRDYQGPAAQDPLFDLRGFGVYSFNSRDTRVIQNIFTGFYTGIFADQSTLKATQNVMTGSNPISGDLFRNGIHVRNGTLRSIDITQNTISTEGVGIYVQDCQPAAHLYIANNTIRPLEGHFSSNHNKRAGILMDNCTSGWIDNNTVQNQISNNLIWGFHAHNCRLLSVSNNHFHATQIGSIASGSKDCYYTGNECVDAMAGPTGLSDHGFVAENSADDYCSNRTDGQNEYGFYFIDNCTPTNIRCSDIGDAFYGLYLGNEETRIGLQPNRVNRWTGTYGSGFGAFHEGVDEALILDSRFTSNPTLIPTFNTAYTANTGIPVDWFFPAPGPTTCTAPCNSAGFTAPGDVRRGDALGSDDRKTALGGHGDAWFNWMAQQRLYRHLREHPAAAALDPDVQAFYNTAPGTALGRLDVVQQRVSALLARDVYSRTAFQALQDEVWRRTDSLLYWYEAAPSAVRNFRISIASAALNQASARLLGHDNYLAQQRASEASVILADNALLSAPNAFAQNEKALNNLYLTHRLWEGIRPDSAVMAQIKAIADQCPRDGGWAVYAARSIYAMFEPEVFWDINAGCGSALRLSNAKAVSQAGLQFMVMPNPASESLTLIADGNVGHSLQFDLLDLAGIVVLSVQIPEGQNATMVDVRNLPVGLYVFQAYDGADMKSGKVVIAR